MNSLTSMAIGAAVASTFAIPISIGIDQFNNYLCDVKADKKSLALFSTAAAVATVASGLFFARITGLEALSQRLVDQVFTGESVAAIEDTLQKIVVPSLITNVSSTITGAAIGKLFVDKVTPKTSPTWGQASILKGAALLESYAPEILF